MLVSLPYSALLSFIQPLSELERLNLGYNCLQRAPTLGLSARSKLLTLILRNNELETINGALHWHKLCFHSGLFFCRSRQTALTVDQSSPSALRLTSQ